MVQLNEIFDVWYGVNLEVVNSEVVDKDVPFVSRQSVNNGVVCHIKRIKGVVPNPAHTLSIAVSGSVLSTFYHDYEYYSGRDVYVAKPKIELTKAEMLYYCYVIEQNKYRYNYGRGANKTFRKILVPSYEEVPDYIKNNDVSWQNQFNKEPLSNKKLELKVDEWQWFRVGELFEIKSTKGTTTTNMLEGSDMLYIAAKKELNGVNGTFARQGNEDYISQGNCIVFIQIGEGSAGYVTYQPYNFIGMSGKTSCGYNKHLNAYNGEFLVTILDKERQRYSFGRSWTGVRLSYTKIKLPAIKNAQGKYEPDWQFMEDYIKSMPYSRCLE